MKLIKGLNLLFIVSSPFRGILRPVVAQQCSNALSSSRHLNDWDRSLSPFTRALSHPNELFRMMDEFDLAPTKLFGSGNMLMDIKETKDSYEFIVDLPGVDSKDIDISVKGDNLHISAKRESVIKEDGENFHRLERRSGHVSRNVALPENADVDKIEAEYKNGVLKIKVGKREGAPHEKQKKIEIKSST